MDNEEKLVVFDKYQSAVDANIVKGALEASGIRAGVIGDSTANAIWMAPIMVVVFHRDLDEAIKAIYAGEMNYEDYKDEMTLTQFENLQACNKEFCEIALACHPERDPKADRQLRDIFALAKDALDRCDLATLTKMRQALEQQGA